MGMTSQHWHARAKEARILANEMNDSEAKSAMLRSYRRILVTEEVRRRRVELAI